MAYKTLTISEEAYDALSNLKMERESFTDVILRLSKQEKLGKLSDLIKTIAPDYELADNVEKVSKRMRRAKLRKARL